MGLELIVIVVEGIGEGEGGYPRESTKSELRKTCCVDAPKISIHTTYY